MNKLRAIVFASTALMAATGAHAADIVADPAPAWTGVYFGVGVGGGYVFSDTKAGGYGYYDDNLTVVTPVLTDAAINDLQAEELGSLTNTILGALDCFSGYCVGSTQSSAGLKDDQGKAGILGRAEIGADYQFDRFIAGLNASFTLGSRDMSSKASGFGGGLFYDDEDDGSAGAGYGAVNTSLSIGDSWSVGGRFGYLVTDSTLLFAAGGYTQEQAKLKARFQGGGTAGGEDGSISAAYNVSASSDEWLDGYYVGGGLETLLTEHFSLKLEYRYADYGSIKASKGSNFDAGCNPDDDCRGWGTGVKAKADISDQTVMATVSFRM